MKAVGSQNANYVLCAQRTTLRQMHGESRWGKLLSRAIILNPGVPLSLCHIKMLILTQGQIKLHVSSLKMSNYLPKKNKFEILGK